MQKKYSETMYKNYIEEVQKSGILNFDDNHRDDSDNSFAAKLANSRYLFRNEFGVCHNYMVELFERIRCIESEICKDTKEIEDNYPSYKDTWSALFDQFNFKLSNIFNYAQERLIASFSKKIRRMDNFCICLFGRTKAGKSTTMEALTAGDGSSIGIGKQNTTQDVKEYHWKELLVVDTPGIDAMDNSQKLEEMALSFADDSDLIVFLLPHQVEEGDFEKFSRFYKQNKPILILMNIKKEIGKRDSMEFQMFLKYSDDIFNKEKVDGYNRRIKDFIFSKLQIEPELIPIIPIHSSSAFMSTREQNVDIKKKLYSISNFGELEGNLIREIKEYGELYRIKNPYDTLIVFSEHIREEFLEFHNYLKEQQKIFKENAFKFRGIKKNIDNKQNSIIKNIIDDYFDSKVHSVSSIVERIFEEKNNEEILKDFISQADTKSKVEECQTEIQSVIQKEIKIFFENFSEELKIVDINQYKSGVQSQTNSDNREIENLGGTSEALAGLGGIGSLVLGIGSTIVMTEISVAGISIFGTAGTLFGLGSANIWNPVGWGLIIASAGLGIWSYFTSKEKKRKIAEAKSKATDDLISSVARMRDDIKQEIKKWTLNVIQEIETNHISVMEKYVIYTDKHLNEIEKLSEYLKNLSENAKRSKFQSMLRHLLNNDNISVDSVVQTQKNIVINVLKSGIKCNDNIPKILARVEEKPVIVFGG